MNAPFNPTPSVALPDAYAAGVQRLPLAAPVRVLALGAFLKNTACWLDGDRVHWRPSGLLAAGDSHGDLRDPQACAALQTSVQALIDLADQAEQTGLATIQAVAHDLHPDFFSTHCALEVAERLGVPAVGVAHHHAHLGVVMAEQGWRTHEGDPVLGLALDGVGLGPDGTAWGGEALCIEGGQMRRVGTLPALALPGADAAAVAPWRLRLSVAHALGLDVQDASLRGAIPPAQVSGVAQMLARGLNCPATTAAGRWFDAMAALLGLCEVQQHEAQAALALQSAAQAAVVAGGDTSAVLPPAADPASDDAWWALMRQALALGQTARSRPTGSESLQAEINTAALAFHRLLAARLVALLEAEAHKLYGPGPGPVRVALGGGCFFNPLLRDDVLQQGQARGWRMALPRQVSCGDAGLALGQAWVAAGLLA
ncbi:carbamoyltransferase HypF [Amphibiibacter pelophylacis]|uniref:Carbamoyltransferase HypF n=1 Tax=Amphibiibacter pelophylacis TaxID=1799477 RepID=A0ACC6NZZ8_9BURK